MIPFTLWFGKYGALSAYIGCIVGSGITAGFSLPTNLAWSIADLWQVIIPLFAFKFLKANISLKSKKDTAVFLLFGWLLNNIAGAIWGTCILIASGYVVAADFLMPFLTWFVSNLIVTILITPILLRTITPILKTKNLLFE